MKHNCPVCKGKGYVLAPERLSRNQCGRNKIMVQCKACSNTLNNKRKTK